MVRLALPSIFLLMNLITPDMETDGVNNKIFGGANETEREKCFEGESRRGN